MIHKRYVGTENAIELVIRHILTNFGRVYLIFKDGLLFACPLIGQELEILNPLEYRNPLSRKKEKEVLQKDGIFRVVAVDYRDPRIRIILEKLENNQWIFYGLCYLLDKKGTGMLDWRAVRLPLTSESEWAHEYREHEQLAQRRLLNYAKRIRIQDRIQETQICLSL